MASHNSKMEEAEKAVRAYGFQAKELEEAAEHARRSRNKAMVRLRELDLERSVQRFTIAEIAEIAGVGRVYAGRILSFDGKPPAGYAGPARADNRKPRKKRKRATKIPKGRP